jgi:UDP-3-O-[3-hydroxymyristoyl] glucosamine N-acyltransferase
MKLIPPQPVSGLAAITGAELSGNKELAVTGINEIHRVEAGDLTFVDHHRYYSKALASAASVILINKKTECPEGKALLISEDPFRDFNLLTRHFRPSVFTEKMISDTAKIGEGTRIGPGSFIGSHVTIGTNCLIYPNVTICDHTVIGNDSVIHPGTVIGSDAFYFKRRPEGYDRLLSCGRTVIGNRVEIGANCTINRGVTADTIIGDGTKMDCLVQVGHDTVIGKNCLFASQVGIAGVVNIGDNVILWGQVGVQKDLTIGEGAVVLGQSGIGSSLEGNKTYFGSPAEEAMRKWREIALIRKLPSVFEKLG